MELTIQARFELQRNAAGRAKAWLNDVFGGDGLLPPNPDIVEGDFGIVAARLEGRIGRARWELGADGTGDTRLDHATGRLFGQWRQPFFGRAGATIRVRAGVSTRPNLPQLAYRVGGQGTVRGFSYGIQRGDAFWSAQLDLSPSRRLIRPVLFLDAGQAGRLDSLTRNKVLIGGGIGVSMINGLIRFDLSHPITPRPEGSGFQFDVVFGGRR
jgi:hemolysin activation/secretion protein